MKKDRIRIGLKHNWNSRQFWPPKIPLHGPIRKISGRNVCLHNNSLSKPEKVMQPEVFKKSELRYRNESNDYAVFGHFHLLCFGQVVRNSNIKVEKVSWNEMKIWTGCFVMQKTSFNTEKKIYEIFLEKRNVCVSKQELKTLFWRTAKMIRTNHTLIVVTRTRGTFNFQQFWSLGFPLGKMLGVSW